MLTRSVYAICAVIILALILGTYVRLAVAHVDTASYVGFLTTAVIPGLPALAAWWSSKHAHHSAAAANETAQVAVEKADTAAVAAVQAEQNTNGKLNSQFISMHSDIAELKRMINQINTLVAVHLREHQE